MKGQRIDIQDLSKALNNFRIASEGRQFERKELLLELEKLGFNKCIAAYAAAKLFDFERVGTAKLYRFKKDPIYKDQILNLYVHYRKTKNSYNSKKRNQEPSEFSEEVMINFLKSRGYKIQRPIGFDLQKFSEMNPELYNRFIKYETL